MAKRNRSTFYGKTIAEINQKLLDYKGEANKGRTFKAVADEWWEEHTKTLESNSLKNYQPAYKRAVEWLGDIPIKEVTSRDVKNCITRFALTGVAQKTATTQLQIIRQILNYGMLDDGVEFNFAVGISIPKNLKKTQREMPSEKDMEKIKNNADKPFAYLH